MSILSGLRGVICWSIKLGLVLATNRTQWISHSSHIILTLFQFKKFHKNDLKMIKLGILVYINSWKSQFIFSTDNFLLCHQQQRLQVINMVDQIMCCIRIGLWNVGDGNEWLVRKSWIYTKNIKMCEQLSIIRVIYSITISVI